jgi:hypothetical protein
LDACLIFKAGRIDFFKYLVIYLLLLRVKVELALPLINDTLYDCPDAAANSSESWEEKVSTPDSLFIKWMKDRLHRDGGVFHSLLL